MRAIAKRRLPRRFAAAEISLAVFFGGPGQRFETGVFMRAVAKGLAGGLAARTPEIGLSGFDFGFIRRFLRARGLAHDCLPWLLKKDRPTRAEKARPSPSKNALNRLPAVDDMFSAANDSPANLLAWGWRLRLAENKHESMPAENTIWLRGFPRHIGYCFGEN